MTHPTPLDAFRLDGMVALITGAGSGMGLATAKLFAAAGAASLILSGRRAQKLDEASAMIKELYPACRVITCPGDITEDQHRSALTSILTQSTKRLDILVNNAGAFTSASLAETSDQAWRHMFEVNVDAPFALTRDLLPFLEASQLPSVLCISSTLAIKPIPHTAAYNAAKAALIQMTRSLALELGPKRIRVNCILPAIVDTPMYRGRYIDKESYEQSLPAVHALHPIGRAGKAEDIAQAALFLSAAAASWITGAALPVDGGMLVT